MKKNYIVVTHKATTTEPINVYRVIIDDEHNNAMEETYESFQNNHNSVFMYEEKDLKNEIFPIHDNQQAIAFKIKQA